MLRLDGYFEVARGRPIETEQRLRDAVQILQICRIGDNRLMFANVHTSGPIRVPDFGHDYACTCEHQLETPYGVDRYFNFDAMIEGSLDQAQALFGTYRMTEFARLTICGVGLGYEAKWYVPITRID
jgi:hypothetical protein